MGSAWHHRMHCDLVKLYHTILCTLNEIYSLRFENWAHLFCFLLFSFVFQYFLLPLMGGEYIAPFPWASGLLYVTHEGYSFLIGFFEICLRIWSSHWDKSSKKSLGREGRPKDLARSWSIFLSSFTYIPKIIFFGSPLVLIY